MAHLTKERARTPLVDSGRVWTGQRVASWMPQPAVLMHPLSICGVDHEYTMQLTDDEMLKTVAEWMTEYARQKLRKAREGPTYGQPV